MRVLMVAAALLVLAGCAPEHVALDSRPTDADSGRALARTVADQGGCEQFADDDRDAGTDHWRFTCNRGRHFYGVVAATSTSARDAAVTEVESTSSPYRTGRYYVVFEFGSPGARPLPQDLHGFPGRLVPAAG